MKHRIFLLVAIFAFFTFAGYASSRFPESKQLKAMLENGIKAQLDHRFDKRQVLDSKQLMTDHIRHICSDGIELCHNEYNNKDGLTLSFEKLGDDTVVVYRNAIDDPVEVYYFTNRIHSEIESSIYVQFILAGNYMLANGKNSVFGLWQDFYTGSKYNTDPGVYRIVNMGKDKIEIIHSFERVSHGDPDSPKYGMPGGGGAGAICPFLKWDIKITVDGLEAKETFGDKFVNHHPRLADGSNVLTKVQCPWEGIDGKWAFTSVMPLTHKLLKLFPKDALELMYAEIFARHGNTFEDAKYQKYFDAQPWYKKNSNPTELTDIEQFNAELINEVIMSI